MRLRLTFEGDSFVCNIHLHRRQPTLHHTKEHGHGKDQHSYPESVPLDAVPAIEPPLGDGRWLGLVKGLLEDDKPVMPDGKVLDPALACPEGAASVQLRVDGGRLALRMQPLLGGFVGRGKQQSQSDEGLLDQRRWQQTALKTKAGQLSVFTKTIAWRRMAHLSWSLRKLAH